MLDHTLGEDAVVWLWPSTGAHSQRGAGGWEQVGSCGGNRCV